MNSTLNYGVEAKSCLQANTSHSMMLDISISEQRLRIIESDRILDEYPVSTAKRVLVNLKAVSVRL